MTCWLELSLLSMVSPRYLKLLTCSTGCPLMNVRLNVGGVLAVCMTFSFVLSSFNWR